jgi:hypothetical protein
MKANPKGQTSSPAQAIAKGEDEGKPEGANFIA